MSLAWASTRPASDETKCGLRIEFEDGEALTGFRLPVLELLPTAEENSVIGYLGPDLLGDFDMEEALRRFAQQPDRPIIQALLDQRNVAGMGNLWVVETCFFRGAYPWRSVSSVEI